MEWLEGYGEETPAPEIFITAINRRRQKNSYQHTERAIPGANASIRIQDVIHVQSRTFSLKHGENGSEYEPLNPRIIVAPVAELWTYTLSCSRKYPSLQTGDSENVSFTITTKGIFYDTQARRRQFAVRASHCRFHESICPRLRDGNAEAHGCAQASVHPR